MTHPRVLIVVGTRPEAIKMAPVLKALQRHDEAVETRVVLTGQHSTMVDQVLEVFGIQSDYDLGIMRGSGPLRRDAQGSGRATRRGPGL